MRAASHSVSWRSISASRLPPWPASSTRRFVSCSRSRPSAASRLVALGLQPRPFGRDLGEFRAGQLGLEIGEVVPQPSPLGVERGDLGPDRVGRVAVLEQRGQRGQLRLGPLHRVVGLGQVVEVGDDVGDGLRGVERLQHVVADEVGEVAHRFHRDRLVEQLHRLLRLDAQAAAEILAVVGEPVVHPDAGCGAQPPPEGRHVGTEVREVPGHRQRPVGGHVEPVRLARVSVPQPEHLGQADGRVVAGVGEDADQHAVIRTAAQRHRPGGPGDLVALGLVVAEHVGAQAPLPGVGPGRLVVGDALGGQQQRGHRVHDGGLPGADVAGEQRVLPVQAERPDPAAERAPVVQLQAGQAEAGHSCSSPASSAAYSASLVSKSASHWPSTNALRMRRTS